MEAVLEAEHETVAIKATMHPYVPKQKLLNEAQQLVEKGEFRGHANSLQTGGLQKQRRSDRLFNLNACLLRGIPGITEHLSIAPPHRLGKERGE